MTGPRFLPKALWTVREVAVRKIRGAQETERFFLEGDESNEGLSAVARGLVRVRWPPLRERERASLICRRIQHLYTLRTRGGCSAFGSPRLETLLESSFNSGGRAQSLQGCDDPPKTSSCATFPKFGNV